MNNGQNINVMLFMLLAYITTPSYRLLDVLSISPEYICTKKKLKLDIGGIYVRVHDLMIILCTTLLHLHVNEKKKAKKGVGRPKRCSEIWMVETETES